MEFNSSVASPEWYLKPQFAFFLRNNHGRPAKQAYEVPKVDGITTASGHGSTPGYI